VSFSFHSHRYANFQPVYLLQKWVLKLLLDTLLESPFPCPRHKSLYPVERSDTAGIPSRAVGGTYALAWGENLETSQTQTARVCVLKTGMGFGTIQNSFLILSQREVLGSRFSYNVRDPDSSFC